MIDVAAAVIEREGRFLLTRRLENTHLAGLWEFPGGKCELGETHEACLRRELAEELGTGARVGNLIMTIEHAYPEKTVRLHFYRCDLDAEPRPLLGQEMRWIARGDLRTFDFPEADRALIELLSTHSAQSRE
jgi:mutator protein MutT